MTRNKDEKKEDEKKEDREGGREEGKQIGKQNQRYGTERTSLFSVYPIHTNFTRLQVYLKSLTQYWAMANRLGNESIDF